MPHAAVLTAVTHAPWVQQPAAQAVASQTHWLATQRAPAAHAAFAPQRQVPVSQLSARLTSQAAQVCPPEPQATVETAVWQVVP